MGYVIAAYAVGVGGVVAYAARLELERRRLRALLEAERQNAVDKEPRGEV